MHNVAKMTKRYLKISRCLHHNICKVWPFFNIIYERVYGNFMVFLFVQCLYITMHFLFSFWLTVNKFLQVKLTANPPFLPQTSQSIYAKRKQAPLVFFFFFFSVSSCIAINSYKKASKIFERNIRNKRLHAKSLVK